MAKWKCEICGNEFDNFHAQGFDNKIYCPLCYFKKENQDLKKQVEEINKMIEKCGFVNIEQVMLNYCGLLSQQKEFISYLENEIKSINPEHDIEEVYRVHGYEVMLNYTLLIKILQKYKEIIGDDK